MRSQRRRTGRKLAFALMFLVILIVSLCFGQVLGNFYLANIGKKPSLPAETVSPKKKALKLARFAYYSIVAGEFSGQEQALSVGSYLVGKGLPAVISGRAPFAVLVSLANNEESLLPLANSIVVDGSKASVRRFESNVISYKFDAADVFAGQEIAPFLGAVSTCLHKGVLLYSGFDAEDEAMRQLQPKFMLLAAELKTTAEKGRVLAARAEADSYSEDLTILALRCDKWAESLERLGASWQGLNVLISQQQALALLEDYGRFCDN